MLVACRYLTSCPHSCATFTKQVPPRGCLTMLGTMYSIYTAPGSCCACAPLRACFSLQHSPVSCSYSTLLACLSALTPHTSRYRALGVTITPQSDVTSRRAGLLRLAKLYHSGAVLGSEPPFATTLVCALRGTSLSRCNVVTVAP